ncbi:MAG TPA: hypothetical protein VMA54_17785 [Steroidobacteraceae bacterium]|nr:hypothetical protein [Steroidobacteraceae bacterium]
MELRQERRLTAAAGSEESQMLAAQKPSFQVVSEFGGMKLHG